jgi:hypothetical protein
MGLAGLGSDNTIDTKSDGVIFGSDIVVTEFTPVMDNVKKFSGHILLDNDGNLYLRDYMLPVNGYENSDDVKKVETDVSDYIYIPYYKLLYVIKDDGTVYEASEDGYRELEFDDVLNDFVGK